MTKRYLNAQYPDPRGGAAAVNGNALWMSAAIKRGTRPAPPTVVWYAERAAAGGDPTFVEDEFIADPTFNVPAGQEAGDTRWVEVTVPPVTGLTWRFRVRRTKAGKRDKEIRVSGEVETWKRYFLDVRADNDALYRLYQQALPLIQRAFAEACIEVVENRVWIATVPKRGKTENKAVKDGRTLGTTFEVNMHDPASDAVSPTLTIEIANAATNCGGFAAIVGNDMVITLSAGSWDPLPIKGFQATAGGVTLAEFRHWGLVDVPPNEGTVAKETLAQVCQRISDREVRVHLDHARLANRYNPATRAWDTPRATSVAAAMAAGPISLTLDLAYHITGGQNGLQIGNEMRFRTWVNANAQKLACVLCHEFAHACRLVLPHFTRKHMAAQLSFNTGLAARAPVNLQVANGRYYDATFGGSGTHCNLGAARVDTCLTASLETFQPQAGQVMCLMYHASVIGADGQPRSNGVRFCAVCLRQLRGL